MKRAARHTVNAVSRLLDAMPPLKMVVQLALDRSQGLSFGSYSLRDEAHLGASLLAGKSALVVVDGGANAGQWSLDFLSLIGTGQLSHLLMIEPNPAHEASHTALHRQDPDAISTDWIALGAQRSAMELHFDTEDSTLASLYERKTDHHGISLNKSKVVQVEPLTDVCTRHGFSQVDLLKIDLEGHELEALKGALPLLETHAIKAIQFEFGGANIDSRTYVRDFWDLLVKQHHYRLFRLLPRRRLMRILKYSESLEQFSWQNLLACAPGVEPGWPCQ